MANLIIDKVVGILKDLNPLFNNQWILAAVILVSFYALSQLIVIIFEKIVLAITSRTKTDIDDKIVKKINRPISLILALVGIILAVNVFQLHSTINDYFNKTIISAIILVSSIIIIRILIVLIESWGSEFAKKTKSNADDAIIPMFTRFTGIVIFILGILYVLATWGVAIGPLLASLGIAGIAVAFALQNSLANIFGGVSLILDKTIRVGDIIKLDDAAQTSGKVVDVGIRSTKIETFDGELVIMPNGKLADSRIQNIVLPGPEVRIVIEFGVAYGSKVEKVKKVVMAVLTKHKKVSKDPQPMVMFSVLGDSALQFKAYCWVASYTERFVTKEKLICDIYESLNKAKIDMPFPQRTVWMYDMGKPGKK